MDAQTFSNIRTASGMSISQLAKFLRLKNGSSTLREIEADKRPVTGPMAVAMDYLKAYGPLKDEQCSS